MKLLNYSRLALAAIFCCVFLASCTDDEQGQDHDLLGKWYGTFETSYSEFDFKDNGTVVINYDYGTEYQDAETEKYWVEGDKLTIDFDGDYITGTFTLSASTLTYNYYWVEDDGQIEDSNPTRLVLKR